MSTKLNPAFLMEHQAQIERGRSLSALCPKIGVTRQTGYRWLAQAAEASEKPAAERTALDNLCLQFQEMHEKGQARLVAWQDATASIDIIWEDIEAGKSGARPEIVLEVVLEQVQHLNELLPCKENEHVIRHIAEAISWEQVRRKRRAAQGVQGTLTPHVEEKQCR